MIIVWVAYFLVALAPAGEIRSVFTSKGTYETRAECEAKIQEQIEERYNDDNIALLYGTCYPQTKRDF